jgi:Fic family protein
MPLNYRQNKIFEFIKVHPNTNSADIIAYIGRSMPLRDKNGSRNPVLLNAARPTILRDIETLLNEGKIIRTGAGRATRYSAAIDIDDYFDIDPDKRKLKSEKFNFAVWDEMQNLFSVRELSELDKLNEQYRRDKAAMSSMLLKKEFERLTIEFAWKSSKIEGNTYTLLDTERLIKEHIAAEDKDKRDAIMILNHKAALDFIFSKPDFFKKMSIAKIEQIHKLLTGGLDVESGIRERGVGIIGTNYRPLDNKFQIRESLEKLAELINSLSHPLEKALAAVLMISYIQPFEDGNKRTARTIGNALLLAFDYCPLSYRSANEIEYKKGIILFYEQNDFKYFKSIFAGQFTDAIKKYFAAN